MNCHQQDAPFNLDGLKEKSETSQKFFVINLNPWLNILIFSAAEPDWLQRF